SVLGTGALVAIAYAPTLPLYFVAWAVAGIAMAGLFYGPAFAALTRWFGEDRVPALTALTLVAGLSSTIFAPLTGVLAGHIGWRGSYLVLAGILAVITIPLHALALRPQWTELPHDAQAPDAQAPQIIRSPAFLLLAVSLTLGGLVVYGCLVNLVPLLESRGASTSTAAL